MSIATRHVLLRAEALLRQGEQHAGRQMLKTALAADPHNERAWLLLARSEPTLTGAIAVTQQYLQRHPESTAAARMLRSLQNMAQAARPAPRRNRRGPWMLLSGLLIACLAMVTLAAYAQQKENSVLHIAIADLQSEFGALMQNYVTVSTRLEDLTAQYAQLSTDHTRLQTAYTGLEGDYTQLTGDYKSLKSKHKKLTSQFNDLNDDFDNLTDKYDNLTIQYSELDSTTVKPPYIVVDQRTMYLAFYAPDQSLLHWQVSFDMLEQSLRQGEVRRAKLARGDYDLAYKMPNGVEGRLNDYRAFVQPEALAGMADFLYANSSSDEQFIYEMWTIVQQLTSYAYDPDGLNDTPRMPLETLLAGGGDCEDTSILLASMLAAANHDWDIALIYLDADHPYQFSGATNHMMVYIFTGQAEYYIETTSPREKGRVEESFSIQNELQPFGAVDGVYLLLQ